MSRSTAAITAIVACFGAGLVAWGQPPYWWLGIGFLVYVVTTVAPRLPRNLPERLHVVRELAVLAVLVCVGVWLFGGEAIFERMANADHGSHFAQAFMIEDLLREQGTVFGWTHKWFTGFPLGYLYPIGGSLWVIAVHLATLGMATASTAYGLAVFGFFVFYGYAVFLLGRAIGGPWVGLLAGVVAMCDPGAGRSGGWRWALEIGVWPNSLATAFAIAGLATVKPLLRSRSTRSVGAFALLMGLALITHPMLLFFYVPLAVVLAVAVGFEAPEGRGRAALRASMGYIIGAAAGLFWLGPFLSNSEWTSKEGAWWDPAWDMGAQLFDFAFVPGWGAGFNALGLVGAIVAWSRGGVVGRCAVGLTVLTAVTLNASFIDTFHLQEWVKSLQNVQFLRVATLVRPLFAVFAAMLVVEVIRRALAGWTGGLKSRVLVAVCAVFTAPIVAGALVAASSWGPLPGVLPESQWEQPEDRAALAAYIRDELPDSFYRIAYFWGRGQTRHLAFGELIDQPWFKTYGGTSAVVYSHRIASHRPAVLKLANVRYVVHERALKDTKTYRHIRDFGRLKLYEFVPWKPDPFTIRGTGTVKLVDFERQHLRFTADARASGQLIVHVGNFSRWHATIDGEPVDIETQPMAEDSQIGFMRVPLRPGVIEFKFRQSAADVLFQVLGLLAILLCLLLIVGRPQRLRALFEERIELAGGHDFRRWRVVGYVAVGAGVIGFLVLPVFRPTSEAVFDFADVSHARVEHVIGGKTQECASLLGRHLCAHGPWGQVASRPSRLEAKSTRRCISASAPASGKVRLTYANVALGKRLSGHVGVPFPETLPKGKSVRFSVFVDGNKVLERIVKSAHRTHKFAVPTKPGTADVVFEVSSTVSVPTCFYAEAL